MIVITPAILVQTPEQLAELLLKYVEYGFRYIDIDLQEQPFASINTLSWRDAIGVVQQYQDHLSSVSIGWDLKLTQPAECLESIATTFTTRLLHRIYVYQTAEISGLVTDLDIQVGVGLLASDELQTPDFYAQFNEVQVMTVAEEIQGAGLDQGLLSRTQDLRGMGYVGGIAIDGGVNPTTAQLIRQFPVSRVSVGSFLQNSLNLDEDVRKLSEILNP